MNLNQHVASYKNAMILCLQENLKYPSIQEASLPDAPYGNSVRDCLNHILQQAADLGFSVTNMDNQVGWCEYGSGEEMIAVLAHLDVVPPGDGWTKDPYGGEVSEGKIWGRGTTDDKGPAVATLYALAALRDSGLPVKRRIRLLFGTNEETGSADIKYYLAHGGEVPVMGFTPDGEYPVINGEKGIINVSFRCSYSQGGPVQLLSIQGGTAPNVVPAQATAKILCSEEIADRILSTGIPGIICIKSDNGITISSEGISAHGSTPELGKNAIGKLLLTLADFPFCESVRKPIRFLANSIGMETDGSSLGIGLSDEVSGKLTLNLGTVTADQNELSLRINYRYPVTFEYSDCGPKINAAFENAGFHKISETHKAKLFIPASSDLVQILMKVYREQTGRNEQPKCIGGGTYAKALPNILAFGPVFPGEEVREHKPDEYITVDNLIKNAQIIAAAIYEMAK